MEPTLGDKIQAPLVLAVDTSSASSSLALARGEQDVAAIAVSNTRQHSQVIFDQLQQLLDLSATVIEQIDLFAAVNGPGSFTGLRIGLAAVQGMARTLGKPVAGISAFDALAGDTGITGFVAVLIDAGREDVYLGLRHVTTDGIPRTVGLDSVGPLGKALEAIRERVRESGKGVNLVGSGSLKYADEIVRFAEGAGVAAIRSESADAEDGKWSLIGRPRFPAAWTARMANRYPISEGAGGLMPYYLKASDAEAKWKMLIRQ